MIALLEQNPGKHAVTIRLADRLVSGLSAALQARYGFTASYMPDDSDNETGELPAHGRLVVYVNNKQFVIMVHAYADGWIDAYCTDSV